MDDAETEEALRKRLAGEKLTIRERRLLKHDLDIDTDLTDSTDKMGHCAVRKRSGKRRRRHMRTMRVRKRWLRNDGPFPRGTVTVGEDPIDTIDKS